MEVWFIGALDFVGGWRDEWSMVPGDIICYYYYYTITFV